MTKDDTVMGRTSEMRIACPLDAAGIAAAIASAEHSQKKLVRAEAKFLLKQLSARSISFMCV